MRADDISIWTIAINRSASVTVGVVWALFVSRWWWPSEARRELTKGLSELVINSLRPAPVDVLLNLDLVGFV